MAGEHAWRARAGRLRSYLEDPRVEELFIDARGKVVVRGERGATHALEPDAMTRAEVRTLARHLSTWVGQRLTPSSPVVRGVLDAEIEVELVGPPLVDGPVIVFSRRRRNFATLDDIRRGGVIEPQMVLILERALSLRSSVIAIGPRRSPRRRMVSAMTSAVAPGRRLALLGNDILPESDIASRDVLMLSSAESIALLSELGVDYVVADDPSPEVWAALFLSGVPFLGGVGAVELEVALERLIGLLISARPGLGRAGAEALIAASIDLVVELAPAGERDRVVALSEIERAGELLVPQRVTFLGADGGVQLAIHGSKLERRFDRLERPERAEPRGSLRPSSAIAPAPRGSVGPGSRVASAILGRGGIAPVSADFDIDLSAVGGPQGRLSREQLAELTPEQLVSQSFLVDVGEMASDVRLRDPDAGGGEERPSFEPPWPDRATPSVPPPPRPPVPSIDPGSDGTLDIAPVGQDASSAPKIVRPPQPRGATDFEPRRVPSASSSRSEAEVPEALKNALAAEDHAIGETAAGLLAQDPAQGAQRGAPAARGDLDGSHPTEELNDGWLEKAIVTDQGAGEVGPSWAEGDDQSTGRADVSGNEPARPATPRRIRT